MKKSTYFIIISSIFLSFLVVFYGGRLLYFRSLSKRLEKVGEVTLTEIIKSKGPIGIGRATATVEGKTVVQAELTFALS